MNQNNSLAIFGYEDPDAFCDCETELEKQKRAIEDGCTLTLLTVRLRAKKRQYAM